MSEKWIKKRDAAAEEFAKNATTAPLRSARYLHYVAGYDAAREQFLKDLGPARESLKHIECKCAVWAFGNGDTHPADQCHRCDIVKILEALGVKDG